MILNPVNLKKKYIYSSFSQLNEGFPKLFQKKTKSLWIP